jgi:hypothetical protein
MRFLAFFLVLPGGLLFMGCAKDGCYTVAKPVADPPLSPGTYQLVMRATNGRWMGRISRGTLTLIASKPTDRSPVTGKGPRPIVGEDAPFYGWTDINLHHVGAPLVDDYVSPLSRDPITPGVLVDFIDYDADYPDTFVLKIGTLGQSRNRWVGPNEFQLSTDGGGIAMWVHRADENKFEGTWDRWGIVGGGKGTFCATRISSPGAVKGSEL